jgi:dTDP-4-amino-4,6-dideoxygalactose transaminase
MRIGMLDTRAQFAGIREEILAAVEEVLASGQWIGGPQVRDLEQELAIRIGTAHAVAVASGTDALLLSLKALGVGPGTEVVVPTFTFFATAGAVVNAGGRPVFADIEPVGYTLEPASFARLITERTKVVIPVDLFGQCADYPALRQIAQEYQIALLEDAAQAIGSTLNGSQAGTLGDLAAFSFYPTKNLGACGDGGMVTTDDADLAQEVRRYAAHGSDGGYLHTIVGTNSRLDALQAAILRVKLRHLNRWQQARAENAAFYNDRFRDHPVLVPPRILPGRTHVYHQYVLRLARGDRDQLREWLGAKGIATAVYYPLPLHLQDCFAHLGGQVGDCPTAEAATGNCLALPVHPDLRREDRELVAAETLAWADRQP